MSASWDRVFWRATAERCIGTAAASAIAILAAESVESVANTDFVQAGWVGGVATVVTLFKCILANVTPGSTGPGFGKAEVLEENNGR